MATMLHNYTRGGMIGLAVTFMILPMTFMCLRVWAKVLSKRLAMDDYLALGALVGHYVVRLRLHGLNDNS